MLLDCCSLAALLDRERNNGVARNRGLNVTLFDSAAELMTVPYLQQKFTGKPPPRLGL